MDHTIEVKGLKFRAYTERDDSMGEPWKEHDGHGLVSDWTSRNKLPGERMLSKDRSLYRYYDIAGTIVLARRDGWGLSGDDRKRLVERLGREPTQREVVAAAVEADFQSMRAWCADEWHWCILIVTLLDVDGNETGELETLGGIESDALEYLEEEAHGLAEEIAKRIGRRKNLSDRVIKGARVRP